jgi:hypothetical protein
MNPRPEPLPTRPVLYGNEGELIVLRISVEPRLVERVLDILARLSFPVSPQLYHAGPGGRTVIEFPAWSGRLKAVEEALRSEGVAREARVSVRGMLQEIAG